MAGQGVFAVKGFFYAFLLMMLFYLSCGFLRRYKNSSKAVVDMPPTVRRRNSLSTRAF